MSKKEIPMLSRDEMNEKYNKNWMWNPLNDDNRSYYTANFGFAGLSMEFIENLSSMLKGKKVLGVLSGTGYLEKCLVDRGIEAIASDSKQWSNGSNRHLNWSDEFVNVEELDAIDAIEKYKDWADYVIMSWPPYDEPIAYEVAKKLQECNIPLIYIGECIGGCTGSDEFFEFIYRYKIDCDTLRDGYFQFYGIHDIPVIIDWVEDEE